MKRLLRSSLAALAGGVILTGVIVGGSGRLMASHVISTVP